ncbi:hypothetical protein ACEI36_28565, partial [Pseudomonas kielensis]|uniref:hypothetical protein n=1 Tax=Pseudomonas kielensis TaxID=2762577 RepID=UPI00389E252F
MGRVSDLFRQKVLAPTYQYTKGLFPSGEAALASLYSGSARGLEAQNHGTGIYRREVCHKRWGLAHSPLLTTQNLW